MTKAKNTKKKKTISSNKPKARAPQSKRKKKRRKSNLSLYYLMLFVVTSCTFVVLSITVLFNIEEITVSGTSLYSKEEIISASGIRMGDNLVRLKTDKTSNEIINLLANIDDVMVKKKFPSKVVITVKPAEPFAVLLENSKYFVISKSGKIMQTNLSNNVNDLLLIKGYEPENLELNAKVTSKDEKKEKLIFEMSSIIQSIEFDGITEIDISDRMNLTITYQNRILIRFGSSQEIEYKLKFAKTTIEEKISKDFSGTLIVRDNGGASIIPN